MVWIFSEDREEVAMSMAGLGESREGLREKALALAKGAGVEAEVLRWPRSSSFVSAMKSGAVDSGSLMSDFRVAVPSERPDPLSRREHPFEMRDDELQGDIQFLRDWINTCETTSIIALSRVSEFLLARSREGLIREGQEEMAGFLIQAISEMDPSRVVNVEADPFQQATSCPHLLGVREALAQLTRLSESRIQESSLREFHEKVFTPDGVVPSVSAPYPIFPPLLNFEWVAARIDRSLGPLSEGT